jgi:hypothetical protein
MTESNRAFTKRWQVERPGKFPSMSQAGVYSAVTHYLKTVDALKSDADGKAVVAKMKVSIWRSSPSWNLAHVSPAFAFVFQYSICAMFEAAVWVIEATRLLYGYQCSHSGGDCGDLPRTTASAS